VNIHKELIRFIFEMFFANLSDLSGYYKGITALAIPINGQFSYVWADFNLLIIPNAQSRKYS